MAGGSVDAAHATRNLSGPAVCGGAHGMHATTLPVVMSRFCLGIWGVGHHVSAPSGDVLT